MTELVKMTTFNFTFCVRNDWFEDEILSVHPKFDTYDEFVERHSYEDTLEIYQQAYKIKGVLSNVERKDEMPYANYPIYHAQEYKISFEHDEWTLSTQFYLENTRYVTREELYDFALYMFHEDFKSYIYNHYNVADMDVEVIDLKI